MSHSNKNKSVITIRRRHFIGILALLTLVFIHVLLMLFWKSLRICFLIPYLSSLRIWNYFRDPLFNVSSHCMFLRKESSLLREIREPVRSYIIDVCSSVSARDCNACFSQILEKRTFGYLNEEEVSLFMTQRTFDSFCSSCSKIVTLNNSDLTKNSKNFQPLLGQVRHHILSHSLEYWVLSIMPNRPVRD